jgi:hypothetical protein
VLGVFDVSIGTGTGSEMGGRGASTSVARLRTFCGLAAPSLGLGLLDRLRRRRRYLLHVEHPEHALRLREVHLPRNLEKHHQQGGVHGYHRDDGAALVLLVEIGTIHAAR